MVRERRSLQDLIRSRQRGGFVGRQGQVIQYQENMDLDAANERRRFLFNIHGDAGVGKTYLTMQLRQAAADRTALTAYIDETVEDVPAAMSAIARELSLMGARLSEFDKRATAYVERRHELASDPHAPDGVAAFLTRTAVTIGLHAARGVPIAGGVLAPVNAAAAAEQVDQARAYLARKFRDHADVRLLLSPTEELTPVFLNGLNRVAAGRPLAFFIDTYERTGPLLDQWLRDMYAGRYGDLPETLITTISGQVPLDPNMWSNFLPVIADVPLEPFSDAEARQFLASRNITDELTIEVILKLSGRLPVWLATLAGGRPANAADIGDPAGDAVERFLKWENDPAHRGIAVAAALPRALNQDVLAAIAPAGQAPELFMWLRELPFITQQAGTWRYHEVAREAMLRLQRAQAPSEWRARHSALARVNAGWAAEAAGNTIETWTNPSWIDHIREETYHLLCADPVNNLPQALAGAVRAAKHSTSRARQWAGLIADAGRDTDQPPLRKWGRLLHDGIHDGDLTEYLTRLINSTKLDRASLRIALQERGEGHRLAGRYDESLADFTRLADISPGSPAAIASRGLTYLTMGRHGEALADFSRAIDIDIGPSRAWIIASRGQVHQAMGHNDKAHADFARAIQLDPEIASMTDTSAAQATGNNEPGLADHAN